VYLALETGGVLVGDELEVQFEMVIVKQEQPSEERVSEAVA